MGEKRKGQIEAYILLRKGNFGGMTKREEIGLMNRRKEASNVSSITLYFCGAKSSN